MTLGIGCHEQTWDRSSGLGKSSRHDALGRPSDELISDKIKCSCFADELANSWVLCAPRRVRKIHEVSSTSTLRSSMTA